MVRKSSHYVSQGSTRILPGHEEFKDWSEYEQRESFYHDYVCKGACKSCRARKLLCSVVPSKAPWILIKERLSHSGSVLDIKNAASSRFGLVILG